MYSNQLSLSFLMLMFSLLWTSNGVPVNGLPVVKRDVSVIPVDWTGGAGGASGTSDQEEKILDAPEYVRSLFEKFTKETMEQSFIKYNTIRSFENTANRGNCDSNKYTVEFNISAIRSTELIDQTILRVHLSLSEGTSFSNSELSVSLLFLNDTLINTKRIDTLSNSAWLEFRVTPAVEWWLRNDLTQSLQGFKIELKGTGLPDCSKEIQIKTDNTGKFLPFLTVYSYETDISQSPLSLTVGKMLERVVTSETVSKRSITIPIQKRNEDASTCKVVKKSISTAWLNEHIFNPVGETILSPAELSVNQCNGKCDKIPTYSSHSQLLFILKAKEHEDFVNNNDILTCVPVEHQSIIVLIQRKNEYEMDSIGRSVSKCGCVYSPSS